MKAAAIAIATAVLLGAVGLLGQVAAQPRASAPQEKSGIAVGQKAPSFALNDQAGQERKLDEFLKQGPLALVFYRSASW
jgi:cytochrome oxidase Cu insertion factor (SCO1/SenC/PrrC family)